jgi:hypothetical protein
MSLKKNENKNTAYNDIIINFMLENNLSDLNKGVRKGKLIFYLFMNQILVARYARNFS